MLTGSVHHNLDLLTSQLQEGLRDHDSLETINRPRQAGLSSRRVLTSLVQGADPHRCLEVTLGRNLGHVHLGGTESQCGGCQLGHDLVDLGLELGLDLGIFPSQEMDLRLDHKLLDLALRQGLALITALQKRCLLCWLSFLYL